MKTTYKKWVSIFGLLAAIIISLLIGMTFDLSILEGMTPEEQPSSSEEEPPTSSGEEEPTSSEEKQPDMTLADVSDSDPPKKMGKNSEDVYKKIMDSPSAEAFSVLRRF